MPAACRNARAIGGRGWMVVLVVPLAATLVLGCSDDEGALPPAEAGIDLLAEGGADGPPAADGPGVGTLLSGAWVTLDPGAFTMGSPPTERCRDSDEVAHEVTLTRSFELMEREVSQEQFASLMLYNPSYHTACGSQCPVEWVSWHEAAAYCDAISIVEGTEQCYECAGSGADVRCASGPRSIYDCAGYRLPTEAEWEYAARAGTDTALHNGGITSCMTTDGNTGKIGWYKVNSAGTPHPRAERDPNPWQLYDMSGNVYEWVNDWYAHELGSAPATDPAGPASGTERVFRGGAWYFNAEHARSANRERFAPDKQFTFVGFRCARTL